MPKSTIVESSSSYGEDCSSSEHGSESSGRGYRKKSKKRFDDSLFEELEKKCKGQRKPRRPRQTPSQSKSKKQVIPKMSAKSSQERAANIEQAKIIAQVVDMSNVTVRRKKPTAISANDKETVPEINKTSEDPITAEYLRTLAKLKDRIQQQKQERGTKYSTDTLLNSVLVDQPISSGDNGGEEMPDHESTLVDTEKTFSCEGDDKQDDATVKESMINYEPSFNDNVPIEKRASDNKKSKREGRRSRSTSSSYDENDSSRKTSKRHHSHKKSSRRHRSSSPSSDENDSSRKASKGNRRHKKSSRRHRSSSSSSDENDSSRKASKGNRRHKKSSRRHRSSSSSSDENDSLRKASKSQKYKKSSRDRRRSTSSSDRGSCGPTHNHLLFNADSPDVVELGEGSNIYLMKGAYRGIKDKPSGHASIARSLMGAVFTSEALRTCSLLGRDARGPFGKPEEKRPGLYRPAVEAILKLAKKIAKKNHLPLKDETYIKKQMGTHLSECRVPKAAKKKKEGGE